MTANKFTQWLFSPHKRLLIKIIPHQADAVYKCEFSHLHLSIAGIAALLLSGALFFAHVAEVRGAEARVRSLQVVEASQKQQLKTFSTQTKILWHRLSQLQSDNQEIHKLTKVILPAKPAAATRHDVGRRVHSQQVGVNRPHANMSASRLSMDVQSSVVDLGEESSLWKRIAGWWRAAIDSDGGFSAEAAQLSSLDKALDRAGTDSRALEDRIRAAADAKIAAELARERYLAAIPSIWPTLGYVSSGFGYRSYPDSEFHPGLDIVNDYGAPVFATATGVVVEAGWDGGWGYKIVIDHGNGLQTMYAHNSRLLVDVGQVVHKGEQISLIGSTGFATGPHVHYQVELWGKPIDPTPYLSGNGKIIALGHSGS